jgi:hypothetical protein
MPNDITGVLRIAGAAVAASVLLLAASTAHAFRCGGALVDEGDSKAEVMIKCGEPDWKTRWSEDLVDAADSAFRITSEKERWLYNLGPKRFIRILLFEDGRLVEVSTGERGFPDSGDPGQCDLDNVSLGTSDFSVQMKCGAPLFIDTRHKEFLLAEHRGPARLVRKRIEEWTYNLGPTQFLRTLVFENGDLVEMRIGDRGFVQDRRE